MKNNFIALEEISSTVLVTTSFRSGSSYISNILSKNGLVGLNREKFNKCSQFLSPNESFEKVSNYINGVFSTHENGQFCAKLMWPHRNNLMRCLGLNRDSSQDLAELFPNVKWIHIYRANLVDQAISFWRAKKSGKWHVYEEESGKSQPDYDYNEISKCCNELSIHNYLWMDFYKKIKVTPFMIQYEYTMENLSQTISKCLQFLGKPSDEVCIASKLKKQRDEWSREIKNRFLADSYETGY